MFLITENIMKRPVFHRVRFGGNGRDKISYYSEYKTHIFYISPNQKSEYFLNSRSYLPYS